MFCHILLKLFLIFRLGNSNSNLPSFKKLLWNRIEELTKDCRVSINKESVFFFSFNVCCLFTSLVDTVLIDF